eukprot:TRINITY_DN12554_c0_g3_i1.p1 TRINITY_DN12554_c0_g3~~TRINITY_DN12554_c0_g3_i1.p1  ORF type:complete len:525 (-),score=82.05 TRINITY_DN12554_c0_g3_i1:142-1716(-)
MLHGPSASPRPPVKALALIVGPPGSGKTSLIRRLVDGVFPVETLPTVGVHHQAAKLLFVPGRGNLSSRLERELPDEGLELELWDMGRGTSELAGGREARGRETPRGQQIHGVLLCYDITDRSSFLRAAHVLCVHRLDWHLSDSKAETLSQAPGWPAACPRLSAVICGTKADILQDFGDGAARPEIHDDEQVQNTKAARPAASQAEIAEFSQAHQTDGAYELSAKSGVGVDEALEALVSAIIKARQQTTLLQSSAMLQESMAHPAAEAWSLRCAPRIGLCGDMTSPRGDRPSEPPRTALPSTRRRPPESLVEVLDSNGVACAPRTVERCLEQGLLHRSVHLWINLPRAGGVLARRRGPSDKKNPNRWGSTIHGEIHCYSGEGSGHASEMSAQSVERLLRNQLGIEPSEIGTPTHCFSCSTSWRVPGGCCKELLDVYVSTITENGIPSLSLHPDEEVDWVFFEDLLGEAAKEAGTVCHMEHEYRTMLRKHLQASVVREDYEYAFGKESASRLERARPRVHQRMLFS